ncbi:MAG: isoprenylcysteine carboxylmethyltransferase family protein [Alphaproteobacteria bacterium]|nr:isoprenylcysteine carboxylmethyltransferase family protein [Alphaproteobacteria bacterium]
MIAFLSIGLAASLVLLAAIIWSIALPDRRLWPPKTSSLWSKLIVWALTLVIFGSAITLGLADWNGLQWPWFIRWGVGLLLIISGNFVVWWGVAQIGMRATSGDATGLRTDGLYRYSRNPQYVADMAILIGWIILSASVWVLPVAAIGVLLLAIVPLAEEKWLEEMYGENYRVYRSKTRRYL